MSHLKHSSRAPKLLAVALVASLLSSCYMTPRGAVALTNLAATAVVAAAIVGAAVVLANHDAHYHHVHCGHPYRYHEGHYVYYYEERWEYYDDYYGEWYYYREY